MSPAMEIEVSRYQQMTPAGLAALIATSEKMLRVQQSMLAAMRKAQKRQDKEIRRAVVVNQSDAH